jgi:hypothetical protein
MEDLPPIIPALLTLIGLAVAGVILLALGITFIGIIVLAVSIPAGLVAWLAAA